MTKDQMIQMLENAHEGSNNLNAAVVAYFYGVVDWIDKSAMHAMNHGAFADAGCRLTNSIDDALRLVPPGFTRSVDATVPLIGIDVELWPEGPMRGKCSGGHTSEPIATVIAAVKAWELVKEEEACDV